MLDCRDRPPGHTVAFFLSMLMVESIFPGYEKRLVSIEDQTISVHIGGTGTPVLLLHGYPQNHATWIKLAVPLARNFTCVIADLPGYGESFIPADAPDHEGFSKRPMAALLLSAMASLGYATFNVMGHDRGARVAYRMALDHPDAIHRLVIIEVISTSDMWDAFNAGGPPQQASQAPLGEWTCLRRTS